MKRQCCANSRQETAHASLRFHTVRGITVAVVLLLYALTGYGQTLSLFNIDSEQYSVMRAKYHAMDADGNQIVNLAPGDFQLVENGIPRTVTATNCPPPPPVQTLSPVLILDQSASMIGTHLAIAKAGTRAFVNALGIGALECAVTGYNDNAFIIQDFTNDRYAMLSAVEQYRPSGASDFDAAFLEAPAGALEVLRSARGKKVAVFLCDGVPIRQPQVAVIIAEALRQNVTIHAVVLGITAPRSVRDICQGTGGIWFDALDSEAQVVDAYLQILRTAQGISPCDISWTSDGCEVERTVDLRLPAFGISSLADFEVPMSRLSGLTFAPSGSLVFGRVPPGESRQKQMTLKAVGGGITISSITPGNPLFAVTDFGGTTPPFTLGEGEERTITITFSPSDSTYEYCRVDIECDACFGKEFHADGGWAGRLVTDVPITVIHPNGGELFVTGSTAELHWEGVLPEDRALLEFSTDGGNTWMPIADDATGLRHEWLVPDMPSDRCLLRATAQPKVTFVDGMVLIPAGSFRMGNITDFQPDNGDEKPVHDVNITRAFLLGRAEVTQTQYEMVMGKNPSFHKKVAACVTDVNWYDAVAFCNELSLLEGLTPCYGGSGPDIVCDFEADGYRLPTEAEWEYACRAGTETDFHTGNLTYPEFSPIDPALDRAGWYGGNTMSDSIRMVGQKEPNAFGVYDMHGNADEWCWDWYSSDYYASSPVNDPSGPATGFSRVARGGNFYGVAKACRSSGRMGSGSPPEYINPYHTTGFRIVKKP